MSASKPARKRVKTADSIVGEILKLINLLTKEHKSATLFAYSSKFGIASYGSKHVSSKFDSDKDS